MESIRLRKPLHYDTTSGAEFGRYRALILASLLLGLFAASCAAGNPLSDGGAASPTAIALDSNVDDAPADHSPTEEERSIEPPDPDRTPTPPPLNLATPAIVIEQPSIESQPPTPIPPSAVLPSATIRIFRPGPGSHVTSPFQVYGRGGPSFNERVVIRLIGEDGRVITERTTSLLVYPGRAGNFVAQVEFATPYVAEAARLEVSTQDPRYGRMNHLTTVELVLLSAGSPVIHPQLEGPEKLAILEPREGALVENTPLYVRGAGWVDSDVPVTVELLDRSGEALATRQVILDTPEVGRLGSFEVELPFEISFSQYGHVVVYETSSGIPGTIFYSSVEVWLQR